MATNRSFANMLNAYSTLQIAKEGSKQLTSERERIRNELIDFLGRKPTEAEIDAVLVRSQEEKRGI